APSTAPRAAEGSLPQLDLILHGGFLEVAHEYFDTDMPAAGNRQAHAVDMPDCFLNAGGCKAQRLNPGIRLGEDEDNLLGRQRPELAVEQADCHLSSVGAIGADFQVGHRFL